MRSDRPRDQGLPQEGLDMFSLQPNKPQVGRLSEVAGRGRSSGGARARHDEPHISSDYRGGSGSARRFGWYVFILLYSMLICIAYVYIVLV